MFQILKDTHFDFMGTRRIWIGISTFLVVGSLIVLGVKGLNYGIEFTGGTEVQLKYADRPDVGKIRSALEAKGLNASVTTLGRVEDREVYIRLPGKAEEKAGADIGPVKEALQPDAARQRVAEGQLDLNQADPAALQPAVEEGIRTVQAGRPCVIDAHVLPGYDARV